MCMNDITIFTRNIGFDSGVMVSIKHLISNLKKNGIRCEFILYNDEDDLKNKVTNCYSKCINLHAPKFEDDAFDYIMQLDKNIVFSMHSTICNLQDEGILLIRFLDWDNKYCDKLRVTCPSKIETTGFNFFTKINYKYLPNTFSYEILNSEKLIMEKIKRIGSKQAIKISLFCAYKSVKNMLIQMEAVIGLAKKYPVELHVFGGKGKYLFECIQRMAENVNLNLIIHKRMTNEECFKVIQSMDIGLQVSLTETFSYIAFEHMISGVPVVGSLSIPFATKIANHSNVTNIIECIEEIVKSQKDYEEEAYRSREIALKVMNQNNKDAIATVQNLIHHKL